MVFESLLSPKFAEKRSWATFFLGFFCTSIAIFLGTYIFPQNASLAIVALTTLFFIPLFYRTMIYEEQKDVLLESGEKSLLKEHSGAIKFFIFIFLGMTLAFMLWYVIFSTTSVLNMDAEEIFQVQGNTINQINAKVTSTYLKQSFNHGVAIFENNIKVMIFCILFSFMYGAGAIFILTWNASVIGLALGKYALSIVAGTVGIAGLVYAEATGCALTRYLIHGIPEIMGYFVAGLAGGIISVAIIKHDFGTDKFEKIMLDASLLMIIAVVIIFVAMLIEVVITPLIMNLLTSSGACVA